MEITDENVTHAEAAMEARRAQGHATAARYDATSGRLIVNLHNGVELAVPTRLVEELADADPVDLAEIEITPAGLGLHWPRLDADVYVPGLLSGAFGSRRWMAAQLGAQGGRASTPAKAARSNGAKSMMTRHGSMDRPMPSPKWCSMNTTGKDAGPTNPPKTLKCRRRTISSFR